MSLTPVKSNARLLSLSDRSADDTGEYPQDDRGKTQAKRRTQELIKQLADLQERLYANGARALLVVLQGMDTSGKDGTIRHVMSGVNPQGCKVVSFKAPTPEESRHDFLWRVHQHVPAKGEIGIFNRSHYEDVLVTRVHGEISDAVARRRFTLINEFERLLVNDGTAIVKFFLHISKREQKTRLEERIEDPAKRWKFNEGDLDERKLWPKYLEAFEQMLPATSTTNAPWYIVPANHKWYRNLVVAERIVDALAGMKLKPPKGAAGIDFDTLKIPD
ncbi:MAG: polyphosphate kinase 2 family protein [Gemmatimonadales bacterium]